jgi:hypothetical protein
MSVTGEIDVMQCLKDGVIGSIGAIPGTIASHPFDAIKIRVQATGDKVIKAAPFVVSNGIYSGLFAGIQQKIMTRGPMFLFSAFSTNICHIYGHMDLTTGALRGTAHLFFSFTIVSDLLWICNLWISHWIHRCTQRMGQNSQSTISCRVFWTQETHESFDTIFEQWKSEVCFPKIPCRGNS